MSKDDLGIVLKQFCVILNVRKREMRIKATENANEKKEKGKSSAVAAVAATRAQGNLRKNWK